MSKQIYLEDKITVTSERRFTDSGQLIVPCAFARTGIQLYTKKSLKIDDSLDTVEVVRSEKEVFDNESINTFRSVPVTIGHPVNDDGSKKKVTSENAKELQVGVLEGLPVRDEDLLTGTLVIANQEAIDTIVSGTVELSAGYTCDIELEDGVYYQTNIRANHIAIVDKGRAGSSCMIADSDVTEEVEKEVLKVEDKGLTEAEAAETLATHEESESEVKRFEAEWAADYAESSEELYKVHQKISKFARKLANKSNITVDASEGSTLTIDTDLMFDKIDVLTKELSKVTLEKEELKLSLEDEVLERSKLVMLAEDLTDLKDTHTKESKELRKLIVQDVLNIDCSDKSSDYIQARLDIICEDKEKETPLGKMLRKHQINDGIVKPIVNVVDQARKDMINRNKK